MRPCSEITPPQSQQSREGGGSCLFPLFPAEVVLTSGVVYADKSEPWFLQQLGQFCLGFVCCCNTVKSVTLHRVFHFHISGIHWCFPFFGAVMSNPWQPQDGPQTATNAGYILQGVWAKNPPQGSPGLPGMVWLLIKPKIYLENQRFTIQQAESCNQNRTNSRYRHRRSW